LARSMVLIAVWKDAMPVLSMRGSGPGSARPTLGNLKMPPLVGFFAESKSISPMLILPSSWAFEPIVVTAWYSAHCSKPTSLPLLLLPT